MQHESMQLRQHRMYQETRERLLNPPRAMIKVNVDGEIKTERRDKVIDKLKAQISELRQTADKFKDQADAKDYVIRKLQNDLKAANDKVMAQAEILSKKGEIRLPEVGVDNRRQVADIINEVLSRFPETSFEEIQGASRRLHLTWPRSLCMYEVNRQRPDLSLTTIGKLFGGRDHSTVYYNVWKVKEAIKRGEKI